MGRDERGGSGPEEADEGSGKRRAVGFSGRTKATAVPKTTMPTPIQIQLTRGLRMTLMMGRPVLGLVPWKTT